MRPFPIQYFHNTALILLYAPWLRRLSNHIFFSDRCSKVPLNASHWRSSSAVIGVLILMIQSSNASVLSFRDRGLKVPPLEQDCPCFEFLSTLSVRDLVVQPEKRLDPSQLSASQSHNLIDRLLVRLSHDCCLSKQVPP